MTFDDLDHLDCSPYTEGASSGLLLRGMKRGQVGYGCLHSWPSLGDPPLPDNRSQWKTLCHHPLWLASAKNLELDLNARSQNQSLNSGEKLTSHFQLNTPWEEITPGIIAEKSRQGFKSLKLKIYAGNKSIAAEKINEWTPHLETLKLRLDFGAGLTDSEFETFLKNLHPVALDSLDFIEDPFPMSPRWEYFQKTYHVRLAADFQRPAQIDSSLAEAFDVIILKPARDLLPEWIDFAHTSMKRVVFTSYLQHPVGQAFDFYHACHWTREHPLLVDDAGFLSGIESRPSAFRSSGPEFGLMESGTGIGFTPYLEKLAWQKLW